MKKTLYNHYYKLGFEYYINKHVLGLNKPNVVTGTFYLSLIAMVLVIGNLLG